MQNLRLIFVTILIAALAGLGGAYAGHRLFANTAHGASGLHAELHARLDLSDAQHAQLTEIEARFASRKAELEREMRAANRELALAMDEDKSYSPKVQAAVDHFHDAMGQLQKATVDHVFEMRVILEPGQHAVFDETVKSALLKSADDPGDE